MLDRELLILKEKGMAWLVYTSDKYRAILFKVSRLSLNILWIENRKLVIIKSKAFLLSHWILPKQSRLTCKKNCNFSPLKTLSMRIFW